MTAGRPIAAAILAMLSVGALQRSAGDVMRRVNARNAGRDTYMLMRLSLHDARGGTHERMIEMRRVLTPSGYRTLFTVTAPRHLAGIDLLVIEEPPKGRLWMYFPAGDHLTEVVTRGLSAMASDFSCEDLRVRFPLEDYVFTLAGTARLNSHLCTRVVMRPRTERLRLEMGFDHAVGWVRDDIAMVVRAEYFDAAGMLIKTFSTTDPVLIDSVWTFRRYSMDSARAHHRSDIEVTTVNHHAGNVADEFDPTRLRDRLGRTPQASAAEPRQ